MVLDVVGGAQDLAAELQLVAAADPGGGVGALHIVIVLIVEPARARQEPARDADVDPRGSCMAMPCTPRLLKFDRQIHGGPVVERPAPAVGECETVDQRGRDRVHIVDRPRKIGLGRLAVCSEAYMEA